MLHNTKVLPGNGKGNGVKSMERNLKRSLKLRRKLKRKKPEFQRQEGYRHKKLKQAWRKPRGRHSKLRQQEKARGSLPKAGYGSPKAARGLLRSGLLEVRVSNAAQLTSINAKTEAVVIAAAVGKAKRAEIIGIARKQGIKVLNT